MSNLRPETTELLMLDAAREIELLVFLRKLKQIIWPESNKWSLLLFPFLFISFDFSNLRLVVNPLLIEPSSSELVVFLHAGRMRDFI